MVVLVPSEVACGHVVDADSSGEAGGVTAEVGECERVRVRGHGVGVRSAAVVVASAGSAGLLLGSARPGEPVPALGDPETDPDTAVLVLVAEGRLRSRCRPLIHRSSSSVSRFFRVPSESLRRRRRNLKLASVVIVGKLQPPEER